MAKAVRVHNYGGPEVLRYEDVEVGKPGPGQLRVRHHAIGVNFIDTYFRTGQYPAPSLPFVLGNEAAGEVVAVGEGVDGLQARRPRRLRHHPRQLRRGAARRRQVRGQAAGRASITRPPPR